VDRQVVGPERRARFVDGGAVLLACPYTDEQWAPVARAWWWHMVGVYLLAPVYPLVALTVWQGPSRQPLVRRVAWAAILTAGAAGAAGPGGPDADDRAAARRSLADQRDTAERMRRAAHRLQLQLERLVAQLGEAAARADELALGVLPADAPAPGLTDAIDGLTAIREALDTVDQPG
jgi:hypothetical protein